MRPLVVVDAEAHKTYHQIDGPTPLANECRAQSFLVRVFKVFKTRESLAV